MATIQNMYNNWCLEELRSWNQVNDDVWLAWFKKWMLTFQKMILEFVSAKQNTSSVVQDIEAWEAVYKLPLWESWSPDFYSIIQLRVAYKTDKDWNPIYRVCRPINLTDYNITPNWRQFWEPMVWDRISKRCPKYVFVDKDHIKIFPTPTEDVDNWILLNYNFMPDIDSITMSTNISTLNLPWYFLDAIDDYITFRLYQAENPEMAQWYYQQFENTLYDNIYWLNKDKRPIDEWFADLRYFYHY